LREVALVFREAVGLARQDQEVKALVRFDERVGEPDGVRRMHIVVHVAVDQQQLALQIGWCI
jgi:hypothetical protein